MNKDIFLKELHSLLSDLSADERAEAMAYYEEYFLDAGAENEEEVIQKLGSPQEVSYKIHEELAEKSPALPEELGAEDGAGAAGEGSGKKPVNGWKIACIVLACVVAAPIVLPLGIAAAGVLFGLTVAAFAVVLALGITLAALVFVFLVVAVALFIYGITKLFAAPFAGILMIGTSFIMLALFLAAGWCSIKFIVTVIPAACKGIWGLLCKLFSGNKIKKERRIEG